MISDAIAKNNRKDVEKRLHCVYKYLPYKHCRFTGIVYFKYL